MPDVDALKHRLRAFGTERDWDQFHTPKNLAMALNVEAVELLELFQWLTPEQSRQVGDDLPAEAVDDELARRADLPRAPRRCARNRSRGGRQDQAVEERREVSG